MNTRLTAAIVAGALAVGILVGAAGTIVIDTATADSALDRHQQQMGAMTDMMAGAGMGSMMGGLDTMGPGSGLHERHHPGTDE